MHHDAEIERMAAAGGNTNPTVKRRWPVLMDEVIDIDDGVRDGSIYIKAGESRARLHKSGSSKHVSCCPGPVPGHIDCGLFLPSVI